MCPHCLTSTALAILTGIPGLMYVIHVIRRLTLKKAIAAFSRRFR